MSNELPSPSFQFPPPNETKRLIFAELTKEIAEFDNAIEYVLLLRMPWRARRRLKKMRKLAQKYNKSLS